MAKVEEFNVNDEDELVKIGKALSSPVRVQMLRLMNEDSMIIGEIAKKLEIPASSAAFHLKMLEDAGLIRMEEQPGTRGNTKLCTRRLDRVSINMLSLPSDVAEVYTSELPVGAYSECMVRPTCGLADENGSIGQEDKLSTMYMPERFGAKLVWAGGGYVEYRFPNGMKPGSGAKKITISMEVCSEAPGFCEDWKSDITLWINEKEVGTWTCPGDFGNRRGRLTPAAWPNGASQYGSLTLWEVDEKGSSVNRKPVEGATIDELQLAGRDFVAVRVGNKKDAVNAGGFNIFGKHYGDYNQNIVMTIEY